MEVECEEPVTKDRSKVKAGWKKDIGREKALEEVMAVTEVYT